MSNFTLFDIKSSTLSFTARIIEELLAKHQLRCGECRTCLDLSSGLLRISPKDHFQRRPQLFCIRCGSRNSQGCGIISFGFVYEIIKCFNVFDMKQLTIAIISNIIDEINLKNSLQLHEKTEIFKTLSPYFGHYSQNQKMPSNISFEVKTKIVLQFMNEIVKKIIEKEVFAYCFESSPVHKLSQEKAAHLIRLLRNQIEIKLEALKNVQNIIRDHSQLRTILEFSVAALKLLYQPLGSFYKTNQSNHVVYSLTRRQIKLKPRQEYSMIQEGDDKMEQLVRLNQPLQSKPVVFKLKCPYRNEKVRLGFFFMSIQHYKAEAEYERPFQPLQIVFNLNSNLQDNRMYQSIETQRGENEIARPNILLLNQQTQRRTKMSFTTSQSNCQEKKFVMSYKKDVKNLEAKELYAEDGTLIELKYQKYSKTVTIKNLSKGVQIYQRKFYTKLNIDLNRILVFPCVVLTGANCTVEYILTE